ncbi:hypothetical protein EDD18DRAFT_1115224 [Armillaria luteobubalina]|uniref:Uncharacterized protein n=1 Tax=Armillaria luteobubalina TaxID=153913 RepID=A0AA39P310_9AGAR|nr:hypothetical protein EDD18DRAFT_1115224 [Armillaria luteobubalina]
MAMCRGSFSACGEYQQVTDDDDDEDSLEDDDENRKDGYGTAGLEGGEDRIVYHDSNIEPPMANDDGHRRALRGIDRRCNDESNTPYKPRMAPLPPPLLAPPPRPTSPSSALPTWGNTSAGAMDATTTRALMGNITTERMHPMTLVRLHYRARRWDPPPRPTSTSPALSRTHMDPMSMHLPLFEWGNMATDSIFPTDPAITRRPLPTPIPALSNVLPVFQASPLARNPTTPIFDTGECNSTICVPPSIPVAAKWSSQPTPHHFRSPQAGYGPHSAE